MFHKMKVFRIYLGLTQKNGASVSMQAIYLATKTVGDAFTGFTQLSGTGVFNGQRESCLIYEIIKGEGAAKLVEATVRDCAAKIRDMCNQECVLVTAQEIEAEFV